LADRITPEQRSANMARIRSRDTKPEMIVRRLLHAAGYRYRLHRRDLPGNPDLIFARRRKVIFVHGCFWHQHEAEACLDGRKPRSNTGYWDAKLARNVSRDRAAIEQLNAMGWEVLVVWACETKATNELQVRLETFLGETKKGRLIAAPDSIR
jgi:DNA mismatch endonuclease (patch repair protein)